MASEEKPAKPVLSGDFDSLVTDITALVVSLNDLHRQMVLAYTPIVQGIIRSGSRDVHEIEHTLDQLLPSAGHPQGLLLFKALCRHYYGIDPVAAAQYVYCYRDWYEDQESEAGVVVPSAQFAETTKLDRATTKNRTGLGHGG
ncbi:MAG: hypothetical protein PHH58_11930 [Rhodoferax sp.]|nr:hypothetical protein [Rhodoferax sp.]